MKTYAQKGGCLVVPASIMTKPTGKMFAAILLAAATAMAVSACSNKDENKNEDDSGIYTPSANDDLRQLIADANAKLRAERQFAYTGIINDATMQVKLEEMSNADTKTKLRTQHNDNVLREFRFTEGNKQYVYEKYSATDSMKFIGRPPTDAQTCFMYNSDVFALSDASYSFSYRLNSGGNIEVTMAFASPYDYTDDDLTAVCEVILTGNRKYKTMDCTTSKDNKNFTSKTTFSYSANPTFPNYFNKTDFPDWISNYRSAKVVWGEGKGENTFWIWSINLPNGEVAEYAPDVAGKVIDYVTVDGSSTHYCAYHHKRNNCGGLPYEIPLADDGSTVIRVVWKNK